MSSDLKLRVLNSRGVALIMVLWVIAVLSVIVMEFCFAMRTEIHITNNYKEEAQLYAMAEGGIQRAFAELIYKHDPKIQQMRKNLKLEEIPEEKKEWVPDGRAYLLPSDQLSTEIRVMSEGGKININRVSESTLRRIVRNLGLEGEARDIVVDSIMDWRDPDDFYRLNGAENEYYQSLKEPYHCKNGLLDSIEELLLIRGVTPDLFYGKKGQKGEEELKVPQIGLKDLFSIYSQGEQIDINSASPLVLHPMLGIPKETSQLIIKAREEKVFENQQDLLRRVPELSPFIAEAGRFIQYRSLMPYYTIESRTKQKQGGAIRGVKCIVKIDPREKKGHKIIQWMDVLL